MLPALPESDVPWEPQSLVLEGQGVAVLRRNGRYVSVECGPYGGGHGHPDRLQLTLYADGVYWLPDPGTGSYVAHDLFWYRSTLAHNAPRLNGESQSPGNATCVCFDDRGDWAWVCGRGRNARIITVIETHTGNPVIRAVRTRGDTVEVETATGTDRHRFGTAEWVIERHGEPSITLRGQRDAMPPFVPLLEIDAPT